MSGPKLDQYGKSTSVGGTTTSISVTTTVANALVFVATSIGLAAGTAKPTLSISGAGLSWTALDTGQVASGTAGGGVNTTVQMWWALAASILNGPIVTITSSLTIDDAACIYASFVGSSIGMDPNGAAKAAGFNVSPIAVPLSSTNADSSAVVAAGNNGASPPTTPVSGGYLIDTATNGGGTRFACLSLEYQIYSSAQSAVSSGFTNTNGNMGVVGAMITGTGPPTTIEVTQVALEQWVPTVPPEMQVTQEAVEYWATTAIVNERRGGQSVLSTATGLVMVSE